MFEMFLVHETSRDGGLTAIDFLASAVLMNWKVGNMLRIL
jgi:hypothetical protein